MDSQIALTSNVTLKIPDRLLHVIKLDGGESSGLQRDRTAYSSKGLLPQVDDPSIGAFATILQLAESMIQARESEKGILYLGMYADNKAQSLLREGKPHESLALLADALGLEHQVLGYCELEQTGPLTDLVASTTDRAIQVSALLGSLGVLASISDDVGVVFKIAATVWEPELEPAVRELERMLPSLINVANENAAKKRLHAGKLIADLAILKKKLAQKQGHSGVHARQSLLSQVAEAWLQMAQQEILLAASAEYSSTGLDSPIIARQVQELIQQVERRLRKVIAQKYMEQYGSGWVHHIESKHKAMYEKWTRTMQKEQTTFKVYPKYSPEILEYSLFEDLAELAMAQWHLFREVFDFGYAERNKPALYEKIKQIIQVRNILAHSRDAPENELLRAKVLCTDILLALDRAGEDVSE